MGSGLEPSYGYGISDPGALPQAGMDLRLWRGELRVGVAAVEAEGDGGGVGVVELNQAVGISGIGDEALPVEEVGGGFDGVALVGRGEELQMHRAAWLLFDFGSD